MNEIEQLQTLINSSQKIVFFTGAGISTESNIPDFRSADGLYNQQTRIPPETILSHTYFINNPNEFFTFYKDNMLYLDAKPNLAHAVIAELELSGKCLGIVTQNIDGLHQLAGSKHVCELHGSVYRNTCMKCHKKYSVETVLHSSSIPYCECGGIIKPDVTLYEEALDDTVIDDALQLITSADLLIVCGTSLSVYPAASFIQYFQGNKLILINKTTTPYDHKADICIHDSLGSVFSQLI